jgi:hypothetical protein
MDTQTIIQYLQIFGLTVFGLFFFILLILSVYLISVVVLIKKTTKVVLEDIQKITSYVDQETQSISSIVKNKITSIDIEKILFGSTVLGGIIAGFKNSFRPKSGTRSRTNTK